MVRRWQPPAGSHTPGSRGWHAHLQMFFKSKEESHPMACENCMTFKARFYWNPARSPLRALRGGFHCFSRHCGLAWGWGLACALLLCPAVPYSATAFPAPGPALLGHCSHLTLVCFTLSIKKGGEEWTKNATCSGTVECGLPVGQCSEGPYTCHYQAKPSARLPASGRRLKF